MTSEDRETGALTTMKRFLVVLALAAVAVGGASVAWAHPFGGDGSKREALRACRQEVKEANPDAPREELKDEVKACLEAKGITPRELTPEQQAKRDEAKACLSEAREANPDADRPTIRAAARSCLEQAGVVPPLTEEQQARRAKFRECLETVRAENPDADRATIRRAVKECVAG